MTLFYEYWVGFICLFLLSIAIGGMYVVDRNDKIRQQRRIDAMEKKRLKMYEVRYKWDGGI